MAECKRTVFQDTVTRITASWCNQVDKLMVAIGCAETKQEAQNNLDIMPRSEIQQLVNNLQSQINALNARIESAEGCLPSGYCFKVVSALPDPVDENIIYFKTGA